LKIAQRFSAGPYAFLFVEPDRGMTESFFRPLAGLDLHFITKPSVHWAIVRLCNGCQGEFSIYEMASKLLIRAKLASSQEAFEAEGTSTLAGELRECLFPLMNLGDERKRR